jgi:hypothetical protein
VLALALLIQIVLRTEERSLDARAWRTLGSRLDRFLDLLGVLSWQFVRDENVNALRARAKANVEYREAVIAAAAKSLAASGTLGEEEAVKRLAEVAPGA